MSDTAALLHAQTLVHAFLKAHALPKAAAALVKELAKADAAAAKVVEAGEGVTGEELVGYAKGLLEAKSNSATKAGSDSSASTGITATVKADSSSDSDSSSDDSSSDSDSDSDSGSDKEEEEKAIKKEVAVKADKKAKAAGSSSDSDSDSSSSSSSGSSDSESSSSDSDSDDDDEAKPAPAKPATTKRKAASSSSSSSSSSSDSSSESSSSDSDSDAEPATKKVKVVDSVTAIPASAVAAVAAVAALVADAEANPDSPAAAAIRFGAIPALDPQTGSFRPGQGSSTPAYSGASTPTQVGKNGRPVNAPFRRVKAELVTFHDERMKDMSFAARPAGGDDYGARASADLLVTRGKGFTKEKNKKKRGSYRGGDITMASHSIKFNLD